MDTSGTDQIRNPYIKVWGIYVIVLSISAYIWEDRKDLHNHNGYARVGDIPILITTPSLQKVPKNCRILSLGPLQSTKCQMTTISKDGLVWMPQSRRRQDGLGRLWTKEMGRYRGWYSNYTLWCVRLKYSYSTKWMGEWSCLAWLKRLADNWTSIEWAQQTIRVVVSRRPNQRTSIWLFPFSLHCLDLNTYISVHIWPWNRRYCSSGRFQGCRWYPTGWPRRCRCPKRLLPISKMELRRIQYREGEILCQTLDRNP